MRSSNEFWRIISVFVLLTLLMVRVYRTGTLGTQSDEGVHLVAAQRITEGDVLYRDLFENRTPLVEWMLAAAFELAGPVTYLGRMLVQYAALITGAILIALFRIAAKRRTRIGHLKQGSGWPGGLLAAALFALTPLAIFWARFTMLEHWQALFSLLAVVTLFYAAVSTKDIWWLAAGIVTGIAILSKQSALTVVAASGIYFIIIAIDKKYAFRLKYLLLWSAGLLIPLAIFLLILVLQGSLDNFLEFISGAERLDPFSNIPQKTSTWITWLVRQPMALLAFLGLVALIAFGGSVFSIFVIWAFLENLVLFAPNEIDLGWGGFSHYALPAVVAIALLAGFGFQFLQDLRHKNRMKWGVPVIILLLLVVTVAWIQDLKFVIEDSTYPTATQEPELEIGSFISAITSDDEPILVLANSVFYHHSDRQAENLFFHYPEYLPDSGIGPAADKDIIRALEQPDLGAVVVSRMHLEDRLTDEIKETLWRNWLPAAYFSYPYQRDIFLFGKGSQLDPNPLENVAVFKPAITLENLEIVPLDKGLILVKLWWQTESELESDYTVFTHILNSVGDLVGQDDSIPMVGFRPTKSWQPGEIIEDWHLIKFTEDLDLDGHQLGIGLYDSQTGDKLTIIEGDQVGNTSLFWDLGR